MNETERTIKPAIGRSVVVMGVAGSGKSTLALALAEALKVRYLDADNFHPPSNVEKMRRGEPLTDKDRAEWLTTLRRVLDDADAHGEPSGAVLACSALKSAYREQLGVDQKWRPLVYIDVSKALAIERVAQRASHFMPASLVDSQFATLEVPTDAIVVAAQWQVPDALAYVVQALGYRIPAQH